MSDVMRLQTTKALRKLANEIERQLPACEVEYLDTKTVTKSNSKLCPQNDTRVIVPQNEIALEIIRSRAKRDAIFGFKIFADPAWDMILDLASADSENKLVDITSLCIASKVPPTTALRWINVLIQKGLVERLDDEMDKRRTFIRFSLMGRKLATEYLTTVREAANAAH